jgi:hypothetical protein
MSLQDFPNISVCGMEIAFYFAVFPIDSVASGGL